jgi:hypothetical protein
MALAAKYDITLVAGDDYEATIRLLEDGDPIDTQGYTFKAEVRDTYLPKGNLIAAFAVTPVTGGATISLTAAQTKVMGQKKLVWDFQSESPLTRTWLTGFVIGQGEVTNGN